MEQTDKQNPNTIAVFWTGGWDSTFRILDLVIHYGCRVQPFYVVDEYRKSHQNELRAIEEVRKKLEMRFPETAQLLLPTEILNRSDLVIPETISHQYAYLRSVFEISWQYEWLAVAVQRSEFDRIEVSFQADDKSQLFAFLRDHAEETVTACGAPTWILQDWTAGDEFEESLKLFHHFSYPALMTSKLDMDSIAKEHSFEEMLQLTWFCHYPWGKEPCGACSVCRHYLDAGLTERFPQSALIRSKVWFVIHPARLLLANPERFVERVRDRFTWVVNRVRSG